ncbi:DNA polymerase IV, partial [Clostridium saudiense]|nr:DNA polymerase IV [Clostridium saudiense]
MDKIILHVDMDAFFASVEQKDNPKLKGKPVIVGGVSERGVVSTCSYEARKYGVKSAMPIFMAQKLCPQGIYLRGRYWRYKEISAQIFSIFREITPLVEPLSIDEAYLDITN